MSFPKILRPAAITLGLALLLAGCGGQEADRTARPAAGTGGAPQFDVVQHVALSASEHDRLLAAAFDPSNRLYAAGFVAQGADQLMAVTRFNADGSLDAGFGTDGV